MAVPPPSHIACKAYLPFLLSNSWSIVVISFAPVAWAEELKADRSKLNVNGGAMALGHPLGATGAKLMTTMLHELERRKGKYALQAICEGGGTANATIIKRVS